ncbi:ABC transporter ATP-binding protein [Halalkalibacter oceani]|uniref:ABC transporter ATP-binding protein n=1 Tax=Halalkalibacter oceani TaxID=1653776 RepID=UPI00339B34D1
MLAVRQVEKSFSDMKVLENINLEFTNGVYGLLAPNGAGKTTLIKMLVTLLFPDRGEIRYKGENIRKLDEKYRAVLGYLPQQFGYYKNYTPKQYLRYLAALKGVEARQADERIAELLELVALKDVANKRLKKFSGGMLQRVGIAQAMLNDPEILILDEPTAGLDPKERARFRNLMSELARDRIVILSTHIVSDVESIANEIIMIKDKRVLYKAPIAEICHVVAGKVYETTIEFAQAPAFRQQYISLAEKQEEGQMKVRFICEDQPRPEWKAAAPTLEDVFLYIYRDEVEQ